MSGPAPTVTVLGDSYAAGMAGGSAMPWPRLLESSLGVQVTIVAQAGATVADLARHQVATAARRGGDVIIAQVGANDILLTPRPDLGAIRRGLEAALGELSESLPAASKLLLAYPNFAPHLPFLPRSKARAMTCLAELNEAILATGAGLGAATLDPRDADLGGRENFEADGLHLSALGHRRLARLVEAELSRTGIAVAG